MEGKNIMRLMPYVLPVVSIAAVAVLLSQPALTGMAALPSADAKPPGTDAGEVDASIIVSVPAGQVMPERSVVNIYITETGDNGKAERNASMPMEEFVHASGRPFAKLNGSLFAINYSGPGYTGQNFSVGLSEFAVDRTLHAGSYVLRTEVAYHGTVITSREVSVEVPPAADAA